MNNGELTHYGVLGMKWGVRRAQKKLSRASTQEDRDKALSALNKHKTKANSKITKLQKHGVHLQKDVDRHIMKNDAYAAKLKLKASQKTKKANGFFVSEKRANKLMLEAMKLNAKSDSIASRSALAKSKLAKNKKYIDMFEQGVKTIDKTLIENGKKRFVN